MQRFHCEKNLLESEQSSNTKNKQQPVRCSDASSAIAYITPTRVKYATLYGCIVNNCAKEAQREGERFFFLALFAEVVIMCAAATEILIFGSLLSLSLTRRMIIDCGRDNYIGLSCILSFAVSCCLSLVSWPDGFSRDAKCFSMMRCENSFGKLQFQREFHSWVQNILKNILNIMHESNGMKESWIFN